MRIANLVPPARAVLSGAEAVFAGTRDAVAASLNPPVPPDPSAQDIKTTLDVLCDEYDHIWGKPAGVAAGARSFGTLADYYRNVHQRDQSALCLSGGGIRSAAFALGVLQALAQKRLLAKFQYLSTVSGGGYIGAWLSRWIREQRDQDVEARERELGGADPVGSVPGLNEIEALRKNSNYLTPALGIASADTWTAIILSLRNILLNWLVFFPALILVAVAPKAYLEFLGLMRTASRDLGAVVLIFALLALLCAVTYGCRHLPSHVTTNLPARQVTWLIVVPALAWTFLLPLVAAVESFDFSNVIFVTSWATALAGYALAGVTAKAPDRPKYLRNAPVWIILTAISSAFIWVGILLLRRLPTFTVLGHDFPSLIFHDHGLALVMLAILGPLWVTLSLLLLSTLFVGFRYRDVNDDLDREWLGRVSALQVFPALLWGMLATACLVLPPLIFDWLLTPSGDSWWGWFGKWLTGVTAPISGLIAVIGGKSAVSALDLIATPEEKKKSVIFDAVVNGATAVFTAALLVLATKFEGVSAANIIAGVDLVRQGVLLVLHYVVYVVVALHYAFLAAGWMLGCLFGFLRVAMTVPWLEHAMDWIVDASSYLLTFLLGAATDFLNHARELIVNSATVPLFAHLLLGLLLFGCLWFMGTKVDVNRFSLHGIYRNRLIRAFLGGARPARIERDQFTNFDVEDNVRMHELKGSVYDPQAPDSARRVLFPVINVTLNLVGGENLAWQERKASSFIITPLACGSATLHNALEERPERPTDRLGAYVTSSLYGGKEPDAPREQARDGLVALGAAPRPLAKIVTAIQHELKRRDLYEGREDGVLSAAVEARIRSIDPNGVPDEDMLDAIKRLPVSAAGISLGTAMTISGAAKSPSQGYHSSPSTAFLMTLFNVRLGAWLANPAVRNYTELPRSGPSHALRPLLAEMFGRTNDTGHDIYLSDGGHFENLGVYEMLRRRCRFILVVDAGQDDKCVFEDLGNAVRKAAIDLGVHVGFDKIDIRSRVKADATSPAHAVGRIRYPEPGIEAGWLIYIKPSYFLDHAPIDVRAYAEANSLFPHESTLDQWFSESQFESYRRLGYHIARSLDVRPSVEPRVVDTLRDVVTRKSKAPNEDETISTKETISTLERPRPTASAAEARPYANIAEFFAAVTGGPIVARVARNA